MLRCPPSRINLTTSDLTDFEVRFAARSATGLPYIKRTNVRLSPGPIRQTSLSLVPESKNAGIRQAASASSRAAICTTDIDMKQGLPVTFVSNSEGTWAVDTPSSVQKEPKDQSTLCDDAVTALENDGLQYQPSEIATSVTSEEVICCEDRPARCPTSTRSNPPIRVSPIKATEPHAHRAANEAAAHPVMGGDSLSSSSPVRKSAVRRKQSQAVVNIYNDPSALQDFIARRHIERPTPRTSLEAHLMPPIIPELVLPNHSDITVSSPSLTLDPGAPAFIPYTRLATTGSGSEFPFNGSHSQSHLRIRSLAEQNTEAALRILGQQASRETAALDSRYRRRSRTSDQTLPRPTPNLERYPLLRPPAAQRRNSGSFRLAPLPHRRVSRSSSAAFSRVSTRPQNAVPRSLNVCWRLKLMLRIFYR